MNSTTSSTSSTTTRRPRLGLVAGALVLAVATSSGAYAAGAKITSSNQIKNGVVNTGDVKNGTLKYKDLSAKTVSKLNKLEGWHDANMFATWVTFPNHTAPSYRIDEPNGVVHLRGAATFGANNGSDKTVFRLPEGYRPAHNVTLNVATFNGFGTESEFGAVEIGSDGDVRIYGPGDDRFVSFEGLSFSMG